MNGFNFEQVKFFLKKYPHCLPSNMPLDFYLKSSTRSIESLLKVGVTSILPRNYPQETIWHCFTENSECTRWNEPCDLHGHSELLKMIVEAGIDVTKVDSEGRSPLCIVLSTGAGVDDINLLLNQGASFNDCTMHDSSFRCFTDALPTSGFPLKTEVVKLLLKKGASMGEVDDYVLRMALSFRCYETEAIRILLDCAATSKDLKKIKHEYSGNLLHDAVRNKFSDPSVVIKFLLENGVRSDEINIFRRTPLHDVLLYSNQALRIVKLLIKAGSPVNLEYRRGNTCLSLAVENEMPDNVIFALLAAGAVIEGLTDRSGVTLLQQVLNQTSRLGINRCKILLKFILIENPNFSFKGLFEGHSHDVELTNIAEEYRSNIYAMESVYVGHDLTVGQFVKGYFRQNVLGDSNRKLNPDLDVLLQAISNNNFFNFSDVIASKFSKKSLMEKLQQLSVYTMKDCCEHPCVKHKTGLNNDCLEKLAKYLFKKDLFFLIMAFDFTCNYVPYD